MRLVEIQTCFVVLLPAHGAPQPSDHCTLLPVDAVADGGLPRVLLKALPPNKTTCVSFVWNI